MNVSFFLQLLLVFHLTGLVLMVGTTVVDFIMYRSIWKQFGKNIENASGLLNATGTFTRIIGIGAVLLITAGIGMVALTHGAFGKQLWLKIKFALVLLLIVNNLLSRRQVVKIRLNVSGNSSIQSAAMGPAKSYLNRYFMIQFVIFSSLFF